MMVSGYLKVLNNRSQSVQNYTYDYLIIELSSGRRKELFKEWYVDINKETLLRCMCNPKEKVKMTLAHVEDTDTYYLKSYPKQNHDNNCYFYRIGSISSVGSKHVNNYKEENGRTIVRLSSHEFKKSKKITGKGKGKDKKPISGSSLTMQQGKTTVTELTKRVLSQAWDDSIFFDRSNYPDIKAVYAKIIKRTSKSYEVAKGITLNDLMYKRGKIGAIYRIENKFKGYYAFVLLQLKGFYKVNDYFIVKLRNPLDEESTEIRISKKILFHTLSPLRVKDGPYFVAGFVTSGNIGELPEFKSFTMVPISNYGIPIESSYERQLYNLLGDQKRLVQRVYDTKYHPQWNGFKPDGLLIDTKPATIVEVFGMSESEAGYHHKRALKISHFQSLKPEYNFWYWDAFQNSEIPSLPKKHLIF